MSSDPKKSNELERNSAKITDAEAKAKQEEKREQEEFDATLEKYSRHEPGAKPDVFFGTICMVINHWLPLVICDPFGGKYRFPVFKPEVKVTDLDVGRRVCLRVIGDGNRQLSMLFYVNKDDACAPEELFADDVTVDGASGHIAVKGDLRMKVGKRKYTVTLDGRLIPDDPEDCRIIEQRGAGGGHGAKTSDDGQNPPWLPKPWQPDQPDQPD